MSQVIALSQLAVTHRRTLMFVMVMLSYLLLYAAAKLFGGDAGVLGLSDDAVRTVGHFSVYGMLAVGLAKVCRDQYLLAWLVTGLLATGEEIHQLFVPFRFACIEDWATNVLGVTFFLALAWVMSDVTPRNTDAELVPRST